LRRFLYAGSDAVMLEGVVERKSWLHAALTDLMMLVWKGDSEDTARGTAMRDLARLERQLAEQDPDMPADGSVRLAFACAEINDSDDESDLGERVRLRELVGRVLASPDERPLAQRNEPYSRPSNTQSGES
jgi:adenylate cyclase